MSARISYYRDTATGELVPPHLLGETEDGRPLYHRPDGYEPVDSAGTPVECEYDEDGNWVPVE